MTIEELFQNRKEIMARQDVYCPVCGERQYSTFGKLYTVFWNECDGCTENEEELLTHAQLIFMVV